MERTITIMLLLPIIAVLFFPFIKSRSVKYLSFSVSVFNFIISIIMLINYTPEMINYEEKYLWISSFNINYHVGVDMLSLLMVILTNFTMMIAIISSFSYIKTDIKKYYGWLLILFSSIIGVFVSLDAFLFYLFWEAMLVPMYFLIGKWGGENRIYATVKFFIYTMSLSLIMFIGIILTYTNLLQHGLNSFEISDFAKHSLTGKTYFFVFLSFLISFAVKIPLFPLHTWLPDAHVEAPTAVSVILAGILLKIGIYGYLRFLIPMFGDLSLKYAPYIAIISVIGVIYGSLMAMVQKDIKKLVAYSSIAHMGLITLGVFSFNPAALSGSILQMINHGVSTGGLFLMIGILYERTHTRLIERYGGFFRIVPFISSFFMIIMLSSIAVPSTNGFVGEIIIFLGAFKRYPVLTSISVSGVILGAVYLLKAYEKMFFGSLKSDTKNVEDLNIREWFYMSLIVLVIFWIGIYPDYLLEKINEFTKVYMKGLNF